MSEAERTIQMVKERIRGLLATLPFSHVPKRMKIEFVYFVILWLNAFPVIGNITDHFTARAVDVLAFGLQETLSSTARHLL